MPKRVLLVDDSGMMRALVKRIVMSDPDFVVVGEAENGWIAIDKVKATKPDVVLLDIEMPKMNGLDAMKRVRLLSSAKVVILSSVAQMGSAVALEARRAGAFAVIAKPSGAVSLNIKEARGTEIIRTLRQACDLPIE
ncbi:MAG: response regulator [Alphaproteobacteria bacterium]|nr:response regulator [Alphaproteobacteria bacterium]